MNKRTYIGLLIVLVANVVAAPTYGQVYKWVDSAGRVNYSSQPPAETAAAKTVKVVEPNISVYTPDESLKRAVEEDRQRKNYAAASDNLYAVESRSTCADSGVSSLRGCQPVDDGMSGYYPYAPAVVYGRLRRPVRLPQVRIPPGTIAGNVVGMNGFIPGNSAFAPSAPTSFARPSRLPFTSRGFASR